MNTSQQYHTALLSLNRMYDSRRNRLSKKKIGKLENKVQNTNRTFQKQITICLETDYFTNNHNNREMK